MAISRVRRIQFLKLFCAFAALFVGSYLLGFLTQRQKTYWIQLLREEHDFDFNKTLLRGPASKFEQQLDLPTSRQMKRPSLPIKQQLKQARKNLIIVSHGRSGSSLMGDIFNHHPSVFYMYEPLQAPERVIRKSGISTSYSKIVEQFLTGVFRCKFEQPQILADIKTYYRKPDHPRISQAIASPPLCPHRTTDPRWDPKLCYPMTSESLGNACKNNYNLTVIKVLISRIPENSIKTILALCKPMDVDCKVVFLIRDPRAVIPSSLEVGFFEEKEGRTGTKIFSDRLCKQTKDNLKFISKLPGSLRGRIKLQRFEDLATNPFKALSSLYEFAGLPVLESVRTWLKETTHLSRKACNRKMDGVSVTCTKDDAWAAANRWRWKVNPHVIDVIEQNCRDVMHLMGYKTVDRSNQLLANRKVPLFSDEYEAKHWFLN